MVTRAVNKILFTSLDKNERVILTRLKDSFHSAFSTGTRLNTIRYDIINLLLSKQSVCLTDFLNDCMTEPIKQAVITAWDSVVETIRLQIPSARIPLNKTKA